MTNIPPLIDGKYISDDHGSHDTYPEALAANQRLAERNRLYGKISNPWNAADLLDENEISTITYALSTILILALCVVGYNHQWWRFIGFLSLFIPIILLEILIQRIPKQLRKILLLTIIVLGLSTILYMRLK